MRDEGRGRHYLIDSIAPTSLRPNVVSTSFPSDVRPTCDKCPSPPLINLHPHPNTTTDTPTMRDHLRKQALESGKTVSRKARSRTVTPSASRTPSRAPTASSSPRIPSTSDDDLDDLDPAADPDNPLASPTTDPDPADWPAFTTARIAELCHPKRRAAPAREASLRQLVAALTRHVAAAELRPRAPQLLPALLKSARAGAPPREAALALQAAGLVLVTDPRDGDGGDALFAALATPVRALARDAPHVPTKVAALHLLGTAVFFGGADARDVAAEMRFLRRVVASDGEAVGEPDCADVVVAALEEWAFLATLLDGEGEGKEDGDEADDVDDDDDDDDDDAAMEACVEQLDSSDARVQIAAGEAIALLCEQRHAVAAGASADSDPEPDHRARSRHHPRLTHTLTALSTSSSKRLSKPARKALHLAFADILRTVEQPARGPRYSTALDEHGRERGSRLTIAVATGGRGAGARMTIDTWWKLHRLKALRRLLREGFVVHCEGNPVVFECLPVVVEGE